ncbi:MAG TPA: cytochrome c oxidase subunit 3, partial [Blastocatellia bacterium]
MKQRPAIDVSHLPGYAFGSRSLVWWGTLGFMIIEGFMFAVMIGVYFYLRNHMTRWPPNLLPPRLLWGSVNTVVLIASVLPNIWYKKAAEREDLRTVRIGLVISIVFAVAFIVIRVFEFRALNCSWDENAYGSAVWVLLGLHATHLITDFLDTVVLTVLMFTGPIEGKRFVDVSENAFYWYFVVAAWIPIYLIIYFVPRWT